MYEPEYVDAIARTLYQGYVKDTTGVVVRWSDLPKDDRIIWRNMAKRAARRIDELEVQKQTGGSRHAR